MRQQAHLGGWRMGSALVHRRIRAAAGPGARSWRRLAATRTQAERIYALLRCAAASLGLRHRPGKHGFHLTEAQTGHTSAAALSLGCVERSDGHDTQCFSMQSGGAPLPGPQQTDW